MAVLEPPLPPGRRVVLPGRGTTFVREVAGPPGAPTLLLLHGWTASADLNWFPSFAALGRRYHVVAIDHRGHGRGIRSRRRFRLSDCADDAAALLDELGIEQAIAVGYSMGGPVAQLLWHRHRDRVAGLVLCATTDRFSNRQSRYGFAGLDGLARVARVTPRVVLKQVGDRMVGARLQDTPLGPWARRELGRSEPRMLLEAGSAIGRYDARPWIGDVDVPTAVVLTANDQLVPPRRQLRMAHAVPGATIHRVAGDHGVCVMDPRRFVPVLLDACTTVASAAARRPAPSPVPF